MSTASVQVNFRMPERLKSALEENARLSHRSLTAEIVARLEESLVIKEPLSPRADTAFREFEARAEEATKLLKKYSEAIKGVSFIFQEVEAGKLVLDRETLSRIKQTPKASE